MNIMQAKVGLSAERSSESKPPASVLKRVRLALYQLIQLFFFPGLYVWLRYIHPCYCPDTLASSSNKQPCAPGAPVPTPRIAFPIAVYSHRGGWLVTQPAAHKETCHNTMYSAANVEHGAVSLPASADAARGVSLVTCSRCAATATTSCTCKHVPSSSQCQHASMGQPSTNQTSTAPSQQALCSHAPCSGIHSHSHIEGPQCVSQPHVLVENTLPAFRHSARLGVDLLELDVQMTQDGQVVVFHDAWMGRMCGPQYYRTQVPDLQLEQLPPLLPQTLGSLYQKSVKPPLVQRLFRQQRSSKSSASHNSLSVESSGGSASSASSSSSSSSSSTSDGSSNAVAASPCSNGTSAGDPCSGKCQPMTAQDESGIGSRGGSSEGQGASSNGGGSISFSSMQLCHLDPWFTAGSSVQGPMPAEGAKLQGRAATRRTCTAWADAIVVASSCSTLQVVSTLHQSWPPAVAGTSDPEQGLLSGSEHEFGKHAYLATSDRKNPSTVGHIVLEMDSTTTGAKLRQQHHVKSTRSPAVSSTARSQGIHNTSAVPIADSILEACTSSSAETHHAKQSAVSSYARRAVTLPIEKSSTRPCLPADPRVTSGFVHGRLRPSLLHAIRAALGEVSEGDASIQGLEWPLLRPLMSAGSGVSIPGTTSRVTISRGSDCAFLPELGPGHVPDAGSAAISAASARTCMGWSHTPESRRIPLLRDVFDAFPGIPIQVDLKSSCPRLVAAVADMIKAYGREHITLWGSFNQPTNRACYYANANVPLFASMYRALLMLASYKLGMLASMHIYEAAIIIPWRLRLLPRSPEFHTASSIASNTPSNTPAQQPENQSWQPIRQLLNVLSRYMVWWWLDPGFFRALNARGVAVVVFGNLNHEAAIRRCVHAGPNAISTDAPYLLQQVLVDAGPLPRL